MKIRTINDVERFTSVLDKCKGEVWLESRFGDKFNLKSTLTRYIALADLVRDNSGDLELFCSDKEDEMLLLEFIDSLEKK